MTQIRALTASDLPDVPAFWRAVPEVELNDSDTPEQLAKYLARNPELSSVALAEGKIVGAAPYCHDRGGHDGRRSYLNHLVVATPYRKQSLGGALVEHCLTRLSGVGISRCNTFVLPNNSSGRAFRQRIQLEKPWPHWQRSCDGA